MTGSTTPPDAPRRQGRPRDPAADQAIITAVYDVIAENGFAGFNVEAVAASAGVGKATIYRRWPCKEDLLLAAATQIMADECHPDTGTLRDDLVTWIWDKYRKKHESPGPRLLGQVIAEARSNPDLRPLLRRFNQARAEVFNGMVRQAQERGEIGDIDVELVRDMIAGTLMHRSLFEDRTVRRGDVKRVVDAALRGVGVEIR